MSNNHELAQQDRRGRTLAAILSFVVGTFIMLSKFWAHNLTGSQGVYSDALESIVNVVAAAFGLFVIYYSAQPADKDHPYGHGKVEYFSAAFEGGLIAFAAVFIFIEVFKAFYYGHELANLDQGMIIVAMAGVANLLLGMFLIWSGKKYQSPALQGSGQHVISDFWTSAGVILGLIAVRVTGVPMIDLVVAFLAGVYLAITGIKLVRKSIGGLMDEEDLNLLKQLAYVFEKHAGHGIIQIHHTKIIRSGWFHHIDAHMVVPEFWSVEEAHEKLNQFEQNVIRDYSYSGEMNFHLDPCRRTYCSVCDFENCSVRAAAFESRMSVRVDDLRSKDEPKAFRD